MGCTSFRAWADTPRVWVHPPSLAKSEDFAAFQCLGQILTQRFLHVIFHGRKQELFCRGSEQTRCQLLAGKYHFQPHSQALTDVSALQSNGNFMDHFLLLLLFPGMEQQIQNALGTQWSPPETQFRAVSPADQETESNHSVVGWVPLENQTPSATRQLHKGSTVQQLSLEKLKILLKDELLAPKLGRESRDTHKSGLKRFGNCGIIFTPLCWSSFVPAGETEAGEVIHWIRAELGLIPHVQGTSVLVTRQHFPKSTE